MIKPHLLIASLLISSLPLASVLRADDATPPAAPPVAPTEPKLLVDFSAADSDKKFVPDAQSNTQVTVTPADGHPGAVVAVKAGDASYPGVSLKPDAGANWDLSAYGHIEVTLTNKSSGKLAIGVRVDDSGGWQDSDTEMGYLEPGETKTIRVDFGMSYGKPGFAVNKASVAQILIFTDKATDPKSFLIEAVKAVPAPAK